MDWIRKADSLCDAQMERRRGKKGGVIEKACESQIKRACADKRRSAGSGCSGVEKVSADVGTERRELSLRGKTWERNEEYFQVCLG